MVIRRVMTQDDSNPAATTRARADAIVAAHPDAAARASSTRTTTEGAFCSCLREFATPTPTTTRARTRRR